MSLTESLEVERKFEVGPDTPVPSGAAFAPLLADEPVVHELSATYYDTAELVLTRHQVTLRLRTGGDDAGWHLKLPAGAGRVELHAPLGDGEHVPADLRTAVVGLVRRRPLTPVARVDNRRHVVMLREPDGTAVVEFCDDHVSTASLVAGGAAAGGGDWREWETELVDPSRPGAPGHLAGVAAACTAAGATASSSSSKLARALGPLPDLFERGVSPVRDSLDQDLHQLLDHDPAARRVTMAGVHQMRVAVRGLRSTIGSHAAELAAETAHTDVDLAVLLEELKVLAAVLGTVRDIQVVDQRLESLAARYPEDVVSPATRRRLSAEFDIEERRAGRRVTAALGSDRYVDLVDSLHRLVEVAGIDPAAARPSGAQTPAPAGTRQRKAEAVLLRGMDRQFARFTAARTRTQHDLDTLDLTLAQREELTHVVRKRAKALRRTVEALAATGGPEVVPLRAACQRLHTVLGDVQDSVTARMWLRRVAGSAESAGESTFGFGVLFEHERELSERTLDGFVSDTAAVTAAYRDLSGSRSAARRQGKARKDKRPGSKR